jgi:hypothetical protein
MARWVACPQQWRSRGPSARSVVRTAAFLRAGQLASWLWVPVVYGIARFSSVVLIGYLLAIARTAILFTTALRTNDLTTQWVLADVAVAVACAVIVSRVSRRRSGVAAQLGARADLRSPRHVRLFASRPDQLTDLLRAGGRTLVFA